MTVWPMSFVVEPFNTDHPSNLLLMLWVSQFAHINLPQLKLKQAAPQVLVLDS